MAATRACVKDFSEGSFIALPVASEASNVIHKKDLFQKLVFLFSSTYFMFASALSGIRTKLYP